MSTDATTWYNVQEWGVSGKGWETTESFYDRFPAKANGVVRPEVWHLSRHASGLYVEFATDSTAIHARWQLTESRLAMPHMAATGVSGLDLYALNQDEEWRWLGVGRPDQYPQLEKELVKGLAGEFQRYRIYLPLYNGVSSVEIGVEADSRFEPIAPSTQKPVVFYGTSITQGAVASRPGMSYTAILGRRLDVPCINLGFSGNGRMEPEVGDLLAELSPSIYVLDAFPNMSPSLIEEHLEGFVRTLRRAHPTTPIIIVERRLPPHTPFVPSLQANQVNMQEGFQAVYKRLLTAGVTNLHVVPFDHLLGDDAEGTVDGSHPTDLGFMRMSDVLEQAIRPLF